MLRVLKTAFHYFPPQIKRPIQSAVRAVRWRRLKGRVVPNEAALLEQYRTSAPHSELNDIGNVVAAVRQNLGSLLGMDHGRKAEFIQALNELFPDAIDRVQSLADKVVAGYVDVLGHGDIDLWQESRLRMGQPFFAWLSDFVRGDGWRATAYADACAPRHGSDIKVPWELARCHHWVWLGQAYFLTGDRRYADEFRRQVLEFSACNPWPYGPNWTCPMEVAIRAANWIAALCLMKDAEALDEGFWWYCIRMLVAHGRHVFANLEISDDGFAGNHYLADIAGLAYLGYALRPLSDAQQWIDYVYGALHVQMDQQVYDDGANFEASTYYHRLTTELFTCSALVLESADKKMRDEYWHKLQLMFEVMKGLTMENGTMPAIGDNDSGELHRFVHRHPRESWQWLDVSAALFQRPDLRSHRERCAEEVLWLLGPAALDVVNRWPPSKSGHSAACPEAGWFVLRAGEIAVTVSCGPIGQKGRGGHGHNDKLSFEMHAGTTPLVVDAGTFVYTPSLAWRNRLRSTARHNTVRVDKEEQAPFRWNEPWRLMSDPGARCTSFEQQDDQVTFEGEHNGYMRLQHPVRHRRRICVHGGLSQVVVTDELVGEGHHLFEWFLQLSPGFVVKTESGLLRFRPQHCAGTLTIQFSAEIPHETLLIDGHYAPCYGQVTAAPAVLWRCEADVPIRAEIRLRWKKGSQAAVAAQPHNVDCET